RQRGEVLLRGAIDPVQVFDQDDERLTHTGAQEGLVDSVKNPSLRLLRTTSSEPSGTVAETQQMQEILGGPGELQSEVRECGLDLVRHAFGRVRLDDSAQRLHDIDHGKIRNGLAEREAVALEEGGRLPGEAPAELEEQARLADSGLAGNPYDLPLPMRGQLA